MIGRERDILDELFMDGNEFIFFEILNGFSFQKHYLDWIILANCSSVRTDSIQFLKSKNWMAYIDQME